jgi:adenylate kinase
MAMHGRTFLFMGRPGCGKDTQGHLLADKIHTKLFSSGEVFRNIIGSGSAAGNRLKADLDAGMLMPTWFASYLFEGALVGLKEEENIVFQGACRILPEAQLFHEIHEWMGRPYTVLYLDISEEEMKKRVLYRIEGGSERGDDGEHAMQNRINEFNTKTAQSVEFFKSKGMLVSINGEQSKEGVHTEVLKVLGL